MPNWVASPKALFTAACGLLEGVLRYLNQHQLMAADIHLCSFDDHHSFDCLPLRIDTIAQDCPAMAGRAFDLLRQLIEQESVDQSGLCFQHKSILASSCISATKTMTKCQSPR